MGFVHFMRYFRYKSVQEKTKLDNYIINNYDYIFRNRKKRIQMRVRHSRYFYGYNVYVQKSLNNTLVTVTTLVGKTIFNMSCGTIGLHGAKRSNLQGYESLLYKLAKECRKHYVKLCQIFYRGLFFDTYLLYKIFKKHYVKIIAVSNVTPILFNGCTLPKKRRL